MFTTVRVGATSDCVQARGKNSIPMMAKVQFLLYITTITMNVISILYVRNVCFGLKILCVHHWNSRRIMARADLWHPVIHFLEVSMVQISLQIARSPSSITHIMYLKCLLHNLCSINVCFKGCDTTSAHYFPGLCSFSAVCLSPDQDISLSVSSDFNCISDDDDEPGTICTHPTRISSSFCKCV